MAQKRLFDFIFSLLGLMTLLPFLFLFAFLLILFSGTPVFFKQERIGRFGTPFLLYKFRTMVRDADQKEGGSITVRNDPRITPVGKIFRKWKLDELPSLWNVIKGDMSLVGPRPDVPEYANKLKGEFRRILQMRPGITGPATLQYANEEQILAEVDDPIKYNDEVIFPDKVSINLEYIDNWSLWKDFKIIFMTIFRKNY